jgi:hypothetical protein
MSTIDSIKLLADLLNILQNHRGEHLGNTGASETLRRIIGERDSYRALLTEALRIASDEKDEVFSNLAERETAILAWKTATIHVLMKNVLLDELTAISEKMGLYDKKP